MRNWVTRIMTTLTCGAIAYGCTTTPDDDDETGSPQAGGAGGTAGSNAGGNGGESTGGTGGHGGNAAGGSGPSGGEGGAPMASGGAGGTTGGGGAGSGTGGSAGQAEGGAAGEPANEGGTGGSDGSSDRPPHEVVWIEDFEGSNDWSVEGGQWAFGTPTLDTEPDPLSGTRLAATVLGGTYLHSSDAILISPEIEVPGAELRPRLKYSYWYNLADDSGRIQVRPLGGAWQDVPGHWISQHGTSWAQSIVDLSDYANQTVQVGFRLVSDGSWSSVAEGWYIDDVSFETGRMTFTSPEDFEDGYGDWSVEGGMWAIGTPTATGEPAPTSGTQLMGTNIGSNYAYGFGTRLVTPEFKVPADADSPKFRYSYACQLADGDTGQLQVRTDAGPWEDVAGAPLTGTSGWSQRIVDLRPYRGKHVQMAFHFVADGSWSGVALGWYIDDVALTGL